MSCPRCPEDAGCCRYCCDCHDEGHVSGYKLGRVAGLREAADWLARCVPNEPSERNEWQQVLVEAADSLCAIADGAPKDAGAVRWPLRALATGGSDGS